MKAVLLFLLFISLSSAAVSFGSQDEPAVLPVPVISSEYFPCSRCHKENGIEPDVHGEAFHVTIRVEGHTEENYGCFDCHDRENRDKLRLFNGSKIELAVSSELCGQCHSTNYKLWRSGLHGKVLGKWNGRKRYTPCTTCHDPHQPAFASRQPERPPTPPEKTLRWRR